MLNIATPPTVVAQSEFDYWQFAVSNFQNIKF